MSDDNPSLDDQMVDAVRRQREHVATSHCVDRRGWTRQQWADDARRQFGDLDGSVQDLLNGHISAMLAELAAQDAEIQRLRDEHAGADAELDRVRGVLRTHHALRGDAAQEHIRHGAPVAGQVINALNYVANALTEARAELADARGRVADLEASIGYRSTQLGDARAELTELRVENECMRKLLPPPPPGWADHVRHIEVDGISRDPHCLVCGDKATPSKPSPPRTPGTHEGYGRGDVD